MSPPVEHDADCHFLASTTAAIINFPLWRAAAISQSGFKVEGSSVLARYYKAIQPPYRGVGATIFGMAWARGAIFYGSDKGKEILKKLGVHGALAQTLPPLIIGTFVQFANMPLVRATITIQDPNSQVNTTIQALKYIYQHKGGISGLWHGVSAGVLKTVPKYICAIVVKDFMEEYLPKVDRHDKTGQMYKSAIKSVAAGVAGAALTNPLDVIRNEMFKNDLGLVTTTKNLMKEEGWAFMFRGMTSNITAVAAPVAATIFLTDMFKYIKHRNDKF